MGIFGNKDGIIGAALGASGAFDKDKKTDKAAAFGVAIGASIGSRQKWTFEDSMKLGATISLWTQQRIILRMAVHPVVVLVV